LKQNKNQGTKKNRWLAKLIEIISGNRKDGKDDENLLPSQKQVRAVSASLDENIAFVKELLSNDKEIVAGKFEIGEGFGQAGIFYVDGMVNIKVINDNILTPLMIWSERVTQAHKLSGEKRLEAIRAHLLTTMSVTETDRMDQVIGSVLNGDTGLFIDGVAAALVIDTKGFLQRAIEKPETEVAVRGAKESFVENIKVNWSLLRRRLPTPNLRYETFTLGRLSRTEVRLIWIEGVVNPKIIEEARRRIRRIDVDYILNTIMVAELIEDAPNTIFTKYRLTERPDVLATNLAEGRFAVMCNSAPCIMIAPSLFWEGLQTVEDYGEKPIIGSFLRLLRQLALFISLEASPFFVAVLTFHHSIIPPTLAMRISAGRHGVPFPTLVEVLFMTLTIDILREAGVRLPKAIGPAIGILGAVVIGQAAVAAGFVSPALIIIIAVAAVSNFAVASIEMANAIRIANYFLIILGGSFGLFGVTVGTVYLLYHIVSLRSFGVPYFYPVAPGELYSMKDTLVRAPFWTLRRRPSLLAPHNQMRMSDSTVKPEPKQRQGDRNND